MSRKTVLIIDDDAHLVDALVANCRRMDLDAVGCLGVAEAKTQLEQARPDLVVLDLKLPDGDGEALCRSLQEDESLSDVPVLVVTGVSNDDAAERCRELGAQVLLKSGDLWQRMKPMIRETQGIGV